MKSEICSLVENETFELVWAPFGSHVLPSLLVFKAKIVQDDKIRFKARVVADEHRQKFGIDYFDTFSPVACLEIIRTILTKAFLEGMSADHLDIKTAYLYGVIDIEIYMKQPPGFENQEKKTKSGNY